MFKKFFGKKNDGFYLQLEDEDASSEPAAKAKDPEQPVPTPAAAQPVATPVAVQPIATPAAAPVAISAPVTATAAVAPSAGTATAVEKKIAKAEEKAAEKAAKAAKRAAGKAETAKVAAPVAVPVPAAPPITNFATDYLIKPSSISGRRMPGANMKGFLELARQVEKPKAFKAAASERKSEK